MSDYPLLRLDGLRKEFAIGHVGRRHHLVAVDSVDLELRRGETLALVGESGSGKSTLARCVLRLIEPTAGRVELDGRDLSGLNHVQLRREYRSVQMVFQDPNGTLNPQMSVGALIAEPMRLHLKLGRAERRARLEELITAVGLTPDHLDRYPHQLSGGQRQRVGIARAISVDPKLLILDEPTSSLDVSVRGQILDLLLRLQAERQLTYLFITHDLQVVQHVAHRVAVMYLGGIVETGPTEEIFADPRHPYTRALLSAAPVPEWGVRRERFPLAGETPMAIDLPDACRLVGRCPLQQDSCSSGRPPLVPTAPGVSVACPVTSPPLAEAVLAG
jgi:oligopeptide/dipeptide ABC transporter ATP-binding protein